MDKSVSVIIPAYNAVRYLKEALDSAIYQTRPPLEIIVIDDGSTDNTRDLAADYDPMIRYVYQENQGIGAARNAGVHLAQGDYISFLDADDFWTRDKLERQMAVFQEQPGINMVFGWIQQFVSPEIDAAERQKWQCPPDPMPGIHAGTLLMPKKDFEAVGYFRTDLRVSEFIEWYGRAQARGLKIHTLEQVLMHRRIHGQNTMLMQQNSSQDYLEAVRAALILKRKNAGAER